MIVKQRHTDILIHWSRKLVSQRQHADLLTGPDQGQAADTKHPQGALQHHSPTSFAVLCLEQPLKSQKLGTYNYLQSLLTWPYKSSVSQRAFSSPLQATDGCPKTADTSQVWKAWASTSPASCPRTRKQPSKDLKASLLPETDWEGLRPNSLNLEQRRIKLLLKNKALLLNPHVSH